MISGYDAEALGRGAVYDGSLEMLA